MFVLCSRDINQEGLVRKIMNLLEYRQNVLLEKYTQTDNGITFWIHKRIFNSPHYLFVEDGTHLNDIGTKKLYKSLRQAVIFAVEKYRSK